LPNHIDTSRSALFETEWPILTPLIDVEMVAELVEIKKEKVSSVRGNVNYEFMMWI
jgi:hypothetical protein